MTFISCGQCESSFRDKEIPPHRCVDSWGRGSDQSDTLAKAQELAESCESGQEYTLSNTRCPRCKRHGVTIHRQSERGSWLCQSCQSEYEEEL